MNKFEIVKFINNGVELDVNVSPTEETVWLSVEQMSQLFQRHKSVIRRHISNIINSNELDKESSSAFFAPRSGDNVMTTILFYNLDMVISVGYRVNSKNGIIFRRWATSVLKEYLLKGYKLSSRAMITKENYLTLTSKVLELDKDVNYIKKELRILDPNTHIFYSGEYYKSFVFIYKILKEAKEKLIIIDPYIDSKIFQYLKLVNKNINFVLIHSKKSKILGSEINKFIKEGYILSEKINETYHDRFIIVDDNIVYHIGTSLNYLGAKTFLIHKVDDVSWRKEFINKINNEN